MSFSAAASRRQPLAGSYRSALLQSTPTNSSPKFVLTTACVQLPATAWKSCLQQASPYWAVLTAQRSWNGSRQQSPFSDAHSQPKRNRLLFGFC